jgi:hypothetical protein
MNAGQANVATHGSNPTSKLRFRWTVLQCTLVALLGSLAACDPGPVAETKQFERATTAVNSAGQPLLDDMALAERARGKDLAIDDARNRRQGQAAEGVCSPPWKPAAPDTPRSGVIDGFCPATAWVFSASSDPPDTKVFRSALTFLTEFAHALSELADGTNAAAATAQLQTLVNNAAGLAGGVGANAEVVSTITKAFTSLLGPVVKQLAQAASVAQERQVIGQAAPNISKFIGQMRDASGPMFKTIVEQDMNRYGGPGVSSQENTQIAARIENYRKLMAAYVVLLDNLGDAWTQLASAAQSPTNGASLAALAQSSAQVEAGAIAIRQSLSELRLGQSQK